MSVRAHNFSVLYIMGWGRSGSTLPDLLLGTHHEILSGGEIQYLWERGLRKLQKCGCGLPVAECESWVSILDTVPQGVADVGRQEALLRRVGRTRHFYAALLLGGRWRSTEVRAFTEDRCLLYSSMADKHKVRVVVDSSKLPTVGLLLGRSTSSVKIAHLVRDPRAVVYSMSKVKESHDPNAPGMMERRSAVWTSVSWLYWNLAAVCLARLMGPERVMVVRYEDLVAQPLATLARLYAFLELESDFSAFLAKSRVEMGVNHTCAGNPSRFRRAVIDLALDDAWVGKSSRFQRITAVLLTFPLLLKFRYPLCSSRGPDVRRGGV